MPGALRTLLPGLLALALTGCFISSAPLIPAGTAEGVFDGRTSYVLSHLKFEGKKWVENKTGTVAPAGEGYLLDGDADSAFVVRKAFGDHYIAQQVNQGDYYYDLLRIEGDKVYVYGFACGDEDERNVELGLVDGFSGEGGNLRCNVSDFDKLVEVFKLRVDAGAQAETLYEIN
ncbi:MAG: hypothetical protein AB7O49_16560 [Sphingomonadales bacterium]